MLLLFPLTSRFIKVRKNSTFSFPSPVQPNWDSRHTEIPHRTHRTGGFEVWLSAVNGVSLCRVAVCRMKRSPRLQRGAGVLRWEELQGPAISINTSPICPCSPRRLSLSPFCFSFFFFFCLLPNSPNKRLVLGCSHLPLCRPWPKPAST